MGRIRSIKPEFPASESMGKVSRDARLLFILLWGLCDDHGRTRGVSRLIASLLFPYDSDAPDCIDSWLEELEREQCLFRYVADGHTYLQIKNWRSHQKIDHPTPSKLPPPECGSAIAAGQPEKVETIPEKLVKENDSPVVMAFPIVGGKGNRKGEPPTWELRESKVMEWEQSFPGVNVMAQLRLARQWCVDNPTKRKTASGMLSFLSRWLSKEQNSPTGPKNAPASQQPALPKHTQANLTALDGFLAGAPDGNGNS